jgi:uncharacterized membrane protein YecN with MAPEG domain
MVRTLAMQARMLQREFWTTDERGSDLARAFAAYGLTRIAFAVFVWLTGQHYDCGRAGCLDRGFIPDNFVVNGLFQWDALQYIQVIRRGYYVGGGWDTTAPFFPAFPMLAWLTGRLFGASLAGGIVLNHACSIVGAFAVTRLSRHLGIGESEDTEARNAVAGDSTLFWLASPLTVFFCVFLSESVFACLSVLVMLGVVTARHWIVLVAGTLLTCARNSGIAVVACAMLLAFERRREVRVGVRGWVALAVTPIGLLLFMLHEQLALGDALAWVHAQARWDRYLTTPSHTIADNWFGLPPLKERSVKAMYPTQELLALAIIAPLFLLRGRLRIPWSILLLGIGEWLVPLLSHALFSAARYQAGNLYFALAIPALLANRPTLRALCWMLFGMVTAWYLSTYPFGVWAS